MLHEVRIARAGRAAVAGLDGSAATDPKRRFFLLARFYGPEPALFDGSFELNNIEKLK